MTDGERGTPWPSGTPERPPGKAAKFAVRDAATGHVSSTWRAWTGKGADDIYLLEVTTGGSWKASHHNDAGVWRIAMTREGATSRGTQRVVLDEWKRPAPTAGWSEGVGVLVPSNHMRPPVRPLRRDVIVIPTSPAHSAVSVRLFFDEPNSAPAGFPNAIPVATLMRPNGTRAFVVAIPATLTDASFQSFAEMVEDARPSLPPPDDKGDWTRFVGVYHVDHGQRFLVDLVVDR